MLLIKKLTVWVLMSTHNMLEDNTTTRPQFLTIQIITTGKLEWLFIYNK